MPIEPPASIWGLPTAVGAPAEQELLGLGADLAPGTMLAGYRSGLFPMHVQLPDDSDALGWWSPDPRGVLVPGDIKISRSLRRSLRRFRVTVDRCFDGVVERCGDPRRPHGWITEDFREAYATLFDLGWAHSVEVWNDSQELVGGLFGISLGGLFAAESKFHLQTDASKVAVVALCRIMSAGGHDDARLIDVQWSTPHLASLGVQEVARQTYLAGLPALLRIPPPSFHT